VGILGNKLTRLITRLVLNFGSGIGNFTKERELFKMKMEKEMKRSYSRLK
jgi:hypothetical protein